MRTQTLNNDWYITHGKFAGVGDKYVVGQAWAYGVAWCTKFKLKLPLENDFLKILLEALFFCCLLEFCVTVSAVPVGTVVGVGNDDMKRTYLCARVVRSNCFQTP